MDHWPELNIKIMDWAIGQGLQVTQSDVLSEQFSFWPGTQIRDGILEFDEVAHPGQVLHELGHIALTPSRYRSSLGGDVSGLLGSVIHSIDESRGDEILAFEYLGDSAVIGWSYFAARAAGVASDLPFDPEIFEAGPDVHERIQYGIEAGVGSPESCQLFYAGMLTGKGADRLTRILF